MANEITVLKGDGQISYQLLFLFPISVPLQINGANVVPTPSSTLSEEAALILAAAEKTALDAGTSMFVLYSFTPASGMTNPQLVTRVKAIYEQALAETTRWYQQTYRWIGQRVTYP